MKKFILVLVFILSLTTFSFAQTEVTTEEQKNAEVEALVNKMDSSSVHILSIGNSGIGICTGVVIKNDENLAYVVTAKHCIGTYEEVYVENTKVYHIEVSINDDLALLVTNESIYNKVPVVFAEKNAKWGDIILDFGYPNLDRYIAVGIAWVRSFDHQYARLTVIPGCSGGGAFNINGEFVGTVWGAIGTKLGILEPLSDVKVFLKSIGVYNE